MLGYVITRHVNSKETDAYWKEACSCIRKISPDAPILIVDDASDPNFLTQEVIFDKCQVVKSEFSGAGEILAYYYYWKLRPFEKAVMIHDAVFIHTQIPVDNIDTVKFMWHFEHTWDDPASEAFFLGKLSVGHEIVEKYNQKTDWWGCFGVQSVINLDFLDRLVEKYDLFALLPYVKIRLHRCYMERVFALLCTLEDPNLAYEPSIYGLIQTHQRWGYTYAEYFSSKLEGAVYRPVVKVWTGR